MHTNEKQQRINMLFEMAHLIFYFNKASGRAGIFFVAYNLLKQFNDTGKFNIVLCLLPEYKHYLSKFRHDDFFKNFKIIVSEKDTIYKHNINVHKQKISETKNILIIFIKILQIIKNYVQLFLIHFKNNDSILENINIYFTPSEWFSCDLNKMKNVNKFIILHDTIPIKYNTNIEWYNKIIKNIDKSTWCFCVSQNTLRDFITAIPERLDEQKMTAVHIAAGLQFIPKYDKNVLQSTLYKYNIHYKSEDNYIFSLCTIDPRKNLLFTIACFIKFIKKHNIRNLYFYLGGGHFDDFITEFGNKFEEFAGYHDRIIRLGYIDDEDVNILYSNSMFFTYLSRYEGFGMPPLEAMQAGTPVITSNNSSIPEVVGDAAVMIDCDSEEQCIKAFEDFYFNDDLRRYYIQKGLERGKLFTWEKTAGIMKDIMLKSLNPII